MACLVPIILLNEEVKVEVETDPAGAAGWCILAEVIVSLWIWSVWTWRLDMRTKFRAGAAKNLAQEFKKYGYDCLPLHTRLALHARLYVNASFTSTRYSLTFFFFKKKQVLSHLLLLQKKKGTLSPSSSSKNNRYSLTFFFFKKKQVLSDVLQKKKVLPDLLQVHRRR
jgi:hypothetical protein